MLEVKVAMHLRVGVGAFIGRLEERDKVVWGLAIKFLLRQSQTAKETWFDPN